MVGKEAERRMKSMKILVLGGTRFFGVHLVEALLEEGHEVTIATRGRREDPFGSRVQRIIVERTDENAMKKAFRNAWFDVVYDDLAYCSGDVKTALDAIRCGRYVMVSSASVYELCPDIHETAFRPEEKELYWCGRTEVSYDEGKRTAECALVRNYPQQNAVMVRFPFVIGKDDYTERLYFYVRHAVKGIPMHVDNPDSRMSFIGSEDAGRFLAALAAKAVTGPVNACCRGTVSIREILDYVEKKTGMVPRLEDDGEEAPYNGAGSYSLNMDKARNAGCSCRELGSWLYGLLDWYVERAEKEFQDKK